VKEPCSVRLETSQNYALNSFSVFCFQVPISTEYFESDVVPQLTSDDLVVTIASGRYTTPAAAAAVAEQISITQLKPVPLIQCQRDGRLA